MPAISRIAAKQRCPVSTSFLKNTSGCIGFEHTLLQGKSLLYAQNSSSGGKSNSSFTVFAKFVVV